MAASNTEQLILAVDIPVNLERIGQLKSILLDNKKALDSLNKAFAEGRITQAELASGQTRLSIEAKNAQQETAVLTRAVQAQQAANKAAAGSVDELAAKSKLLTLQVNALGTEQKKTAAGRELVAQLKATNDALKAAGAQVSDFRRNVGNYRGDMLAAAKDLNLFGVNVGQVSGNLSGKLTQGLDLAKKGFGSLRAAVASTGIGLLLVAFTSLFEYFQKTDDGAELLEAVFAGLGAAVDVVSGVVIRFGKGLVAAASNPKQAFADLVDFLEGQVLNRLRAFAVIIEAVKAGNVKEIANGFLQLNTGVVDVIGKVQQFGEGIKATAVEAARAAKVAYDLSTATNKLDDDRRDSVVQLEKERNIIDRLLLSARDRGQSERQRLANLAEASRLEEQGLATTTKLAAEKLRILQATNAEAERTGKISDEQRDAATEAEAELVRLAGQSATLQQQIANRRAGLLEQVLADRRAAAAAELEKQRDAVRARQTMLELELLEVQKGSAAELAVKQRQIEAARDLELLGEKLTADQRKLIRAKAAVELQQLADEFGQKMSEAERKRIETSKTEQQREYAEAQQNLADYLAKKRAQVEQDFAEGRISENEQARQLNAIDKAGLAAELVNAMDYAKDYGAIQKKQADNEIKERQRVKAEKKKIADVEDNIRQKSLQAGLAASDLLVQALGEETAAGQVALGIKKTLALAEIGINLEKQLSANAEAGAKISAEAPPLTIPLGVAYKIAADAVDIVAAASASAKILGFNRGGIVPGGGPDVDSTTPVLLTNGEGIMTREAVNQYGPLLGHLNALAGGVNFAPGYTPAQPIPCTFDGGLMARQLGGGQVIDYQKLAEACASVPVFANPTLLNKAASDRSQRIARFTLQ